MNESHNTQTIVIKRDNHIDYVPMAKQYALKGFLGFCDSLERLEAYLSTKSLPKLSERL